MRWPRSLVLVVVVGSMMSAAGQAHAEDLQDYLDRASEADYAGTRIVLTVWDGRSHAEMIALEHSGDVLMLGAGDGEAMIVEGKVTKSDGGGVAVSTWTPPAISEKYTVGEVAGQTRLGRPAKSVTILEGDAVRARIVFDLDTWAPLSTEIYDGEGELFRIASFTEFDPHPQHAYGAAPDHGLDYDVVPSVADSSLAPSAGGYERVDIYSGSDGVDQAFFSDGLFSFSVFEVSPRRVKARFEGSASMSVGGADYLVLVEPSELWVAWEHGGVAYVLVGDLPPDHLEQVLLDLPRPKGRNLFERILGLFG